MKYPKNQFEVLASFLEKIKNVYDLETSNLHSLHFECYQQNAEGQEHNSLWLVNNKLKRKHQLKEGEKATQFFHSKFDFKLYPDGCNDSHVETAMKQAIKLVS